MLSVKPISTSIPEQTRRVAHSAFPQGNVYIWLRDELEVVYQDEDFADLYSSQGQPGISAGQLAKGKHYAISRRLTRLSGSRCGEKSN